MAELKTLSSSEHTKTLRKVCSSQEEGCLLLPALTWVLILSLASAASSPQRAASPCWFELGSAGNSLPQRAGHVPSKGQ